MTKQIYSDPSSWLHRASTMLNPFITNWCT